MSQRVFQQVVSLGPNCRAKFQIQRVYGKHIAKRGVFDWQVTPGSAFLEYLSRDFRGMFEKQDLVLEGGIVKNARFATSHNHEFPFDIAEGQIDALYADARRRHDFSCATTRAALNNGLSTLFVLAGPVPDEVTSALRQHLAQASPTKAFYILEAPVDDETDWRGTAEIWDRHFAAFQITPPFRAKLDYQFHRLARNLRFAVPRPFQRARKGVF